MSDKTGCTALRSFTAFQMPAGNLSIDCLDRRTCGARAGPRRAEDHSVLTFAYPTTQMDYQWTINALTPSIHSVRMPIGHGAELRGVAFVRIDGQIAAAKIVVIPVNSKLVGEIDDQ